MCRLLVNIDKVLLALFTGGALAFVILAYQDRLPGFGSRHRGPFKEQGWDGPIATDPAPEGRAAYGSTRVSGAK